MESQVLRPKHKTLELQGKLSYRESLQAWSLIWMKKELINEFPDLKEKRSSFSYKMVFYQTPQELERAVKAMRNEGKPLPILLFLVKEQETD